MKEKTVSRSKAARRLETVPRSKTAPWIRVQREDDEAMGEILFILKRLMATVRNDLNILPLNTAISLLRRVLEDETYPEETRSILHHHLRRALLTRYCFFGCIEDLEACFPHEESICIVIAKGTTCQDIGKDEEIKSAIELIDECRQCIDTATLDDIIWVAEESITLYTEGKKVLQKAEFLILLGNALTMRYLHFLRDLELTGAANKFREAEYLCIGNIPLSYICLTMLTHIGWLRATECGCDRGMMDVNEHMGKAQSIDEEGAKLFQLGAKMAKEAVEISQMQEAITHLNVSLCYRMPPHPQRLSTLNCLSNALSTCFSWGGDLEDLEDSIILNREGVSMMSTHHPDHALWLNNLANALLTLFQQKGAFHDLEECIGLHREALDLFPPPHPHRSGSLNNLASALETRFEHKGEFQDLEECIGLHREALGLRPLSHPDRSSSLNNLANALSTRFEQTGAFQDLEECIGMHREALGLLPPPHPDRSSSLNDLANALMICFEQKGAFQDLEECIGLHREALDLFPPPHPHRSGSLNNLASALETRFEHKGEFQDLEECIGLHREALGLQPLSHPNRSALLNNLAGALSIRFEQKGAFQDLEECIGLHREALDLFRPPHPHRSGSLNNLASALETRFQHKGEFQDLEESIGLHREALGLRPLTHPDRSGSLGNLANALSSRFEQTGAFQDLDECIGLHQEALGLRPPPHPDRSASLNNLAGALTIRFNQKGAFRDLEDCIPLHREALELRPPPHPDRWGSLNNLAGALTIRFDQKGAFRDLEECIPLYREALELQLPPHPDRSTSLNNLASALKTRFEQKGAFQDLEECVQLHREALGLLPPPHPHRSDSLNNLASALTTRFEQKGTFQNLEECIRLHREALLLRRPPHPGRSGSLNNLANALSTRFEQKGAFQDLEECIGMHREALDLQPSPHLNRSGSLNNLAGALKTRFDQKGAFQDLEECIGMHREALGLLPPPHPDRSGSLNNLANALSTSFVQNGALRDLEECIQLHREALDLLPPPHPNRLDSLNNLGNSHRIRYEHKKEDADLEQALRFYELAFQYETGSLLNRLKSVISFAPFARAYCPATSLNGYHYALELLPLLASIDLTLKERQDVLEHARQLVGNATQCAISQDQFETAVTFLSTGRSIFWSQALQLRTRVDELAILNPTLAKTYLDASRQLELASHNSTDHLHTSLASDRQYPNPPAFKSLPKLADQRRRAIEEIRRIPGFESFLLPPSFTSLRRAAHNGPVALLNASKDGCDALIMRESLSVQHVPLSDIIDLEDVEALQLLFHTSLAGGLRSINDAQPQVRTAIDALQALLSRGLVRERSSVPNKDPVQIALQVLWIKVVQPVVAALALQRTSVPGRLWWCPSGAFASLPIHAAGIYSDNNNPIDCLFQYVVSSYCTSPQDLIHPQPEISPGFKVTAIIEPEAPGGKSLPAALNELDNIRQHIPDSGQLITRLGLQSAPNKIDVVLPDIQRSSIVHFGCHGMQNLDDPLESYLLLSGGKLTMSRIIKDCQISNSAALAYLSACETAKGDDERPDESLNLVATMMFAGFRSVVGTMWPIYDSDAPIVADVFYGHLFRNGKDAPPDVRDAAYGLHLATAKLREQKKGFRSWVPYVHYGI